MKRRNPVAKFSRQFNKATTMIDRKKALKSGYKKYKILINNTNNISEDV